MTKGLINVPSSFFCSLWADTFGQGLRIEADDLEASQMRHPLVADHCVLADSQGGLRAFAVLKMPATPGVYPGQDPGRWHLSALACRSIADGLEAVQKILESQAIVAATSVVFGMDSDHLLPGVPTTATLVEEVLLRSGFQQAGECFDLERDLLDYELPSRCRSALDEAEASVARCRPEDVPFLDDFLAREFPGRWRHDVLRKASVDCEPDDIVLLWREHRIEGFALTQKPGVRRPIGGAVWRAVLGQNWGALGPIGVSKAVRGRGLGDALLGCTLDTLARTGTRRTVIDWTTLDRFYGSHGFSVTRRYRLLAKPLS